MDIEVDQSWHGTQAGDAPVVAAVQNLLTALDVPVASSSVEESLKSHPYYPTLAAAEGCLAGWGVVSSSFEVEAQILPQLPLPCLAALQRRDEATGSMTLSLAVVLEVGDDTVDLVEPEFGAQRVSRQDFARDWNGQVLAVEPAGEAGQSDYVERRAAERTDRWLRRAGRILGFAALAAVVSATAWLLAGSPVALGHWALKLAGAGLCWILLGHYLDAGRSLLGRFCPRGEEGGCQSVLDSDGARLFGRVPLADVGFVYFVAGALALTLGGIAGSAGAASALLVDLALLGLPMVVYSVVYQAVVLRGWCWICLLVQAILLAEAAAWWWLEPAAASAGEVPATIWLAVALPFVVTAALWSRLRPLLGRDEKLRDAEFRYRRVLRHPRVVEGLLSSGRQVPQARCDGDLVLGNPEAPHEILVVTHPGCRYCSQAHQDALQLHRRFPEQVVVRFRMLGLMAKGAAQEAAICCTALSLEQRMGEACGLLERWFECESEPEREGLTDLYPLRDEDSAAAARKALTRSTAWARGHGIHGTPTVFVDQKQIDAELDLDDLETFLAESPEPRPVAVPA